MAISRRVELLKALLGSQRGADSPQKSFSRLICSPLISGIFDATAARSSAKQRLLERRSSKESHCYAATTQAHRALVECDVPVRPDDAAEQLDATSLRGALLLAR
nr:hypothetical protein CFP56_10387 [Quercus suber]